MWSRRQTSWMVAAVVAFGTLLGTAGCLVQPTTSTVKANEWSVGEPSLIGGTALASTDLSILQSGQTRQATIIAPTDRPHGERMAAVIVLHGLGSSAYDALIDGNWLPQLQTKHL